MALLKFRGIGPHVRNEIERYELVPSSKLVMAPLGVSSEFTLAASHNDAELACIEQLLSQTRGAPFLLHVGSCIPRKRHQIRDCDEVVCNTVGGIQQALSCTLNPPNCSRPNPFRSFPSVIKP